MSKKTSTRASSKRKMILELIMMNKIKKDLWTLNHPTKNYQEFKYVEPQPVVE